ncbi:antimicrobial peptide system SdpB family protein [Kroppenstedtia sanguinis]|uniref:sporulation-delaying protein SdpB family protein n=1 Tax=Kroppenstedtia sanguinis TaxID=1380684 RepID=UPI003D21F24C
MLESIDKKILNWAVNNNPWTNVYALARSLMALSTALTLAINDAQTFFRPASGIEEYPICSESISVFCMISNDYAYLDLLRWFSVVILFVVASGWRPRITGVIHWWIAYSLNVSAITLDGGEQVSAVLTFLLIPVTLTDSRKWHWEKQRPNKLSNKEVHSRIIALVSLMAIRLQVAILYFDSTVEKLRERTWIEGTAVYYFMQDPMLGLPSMLHKLSDPILTSPLVVIPTWGTLILQAALFGALFSPKKYRKYFFFGALMFHEVIAIMLGLISFSIIMIGALILYLWPHEKEFAFINRILLYEKVKQEPKAN